jgi:hypothetical protein
MATACSDNEPLYLPLRIEQGETKIIPLHVIDASELDVDITGYTFAAQIRRKPSSTVISATFSSTITTPADGLMQFSLTAAQTAAITCGDTDTEGYQACLWRGRHGCSGDAMIRLTIPSLRDIMLAYRDILLNAVGLTRRAKINFTGGGVRASDNPSTQSTDVTIAGGGLTTVIHGVSATVAAWTLGRFDVVAPATATLSNGVNNGDRVAVAWADSSGNNLTVAMTNVDDAYGSSIVLGDTGVLRVNFVWIVPAEGVAKWQPESSFYIPNG